MLPAALKDAYRALGLVGMLAVALAGCWMFASLDDFPTAGGEGGSDGGSADTTPPSCLGASTNDCPAEDGGVESCCTSLFVDGGTFLRHYDGVTAGNTNGLRTASLHGFRLDRYAATVGRFRQFVDAVVQAGGVAPLVHAGSGRHAHLNDGGGLNEEYGPGFEPGWDPSWDTGIATTQGGWDTNLSCGSGASWPQPNGDHLPINCVTWYEAYAFCIWDGGFLPSDAELNYAASGGDEQRVYPWSSPPDASGIDCSFANYLTCLGAPSGVGATSPKSDGKWHQTDLAGNVWEWTLDWLNDATQSCFDCANLDDPGDGGCTSFAGACRMQRGGSFENDPTLLYAATSGADDPSARGAYTGFRCARSP